MPIDLTTLTPAELAERGAKCLGWHTIQDHRPLWFDPMRMSAVANVIGKPIGDWELEIYSPATDDSQAAELMRAAVAKCGATAYRRALADLRPQDDGEGLIDRHFLAANWLATADARARTCAALVCLEGREAKGES